MIKFNEKKQKKKVKRLHSKEQEELASILSEKYGLEYIDLSTVSINPSAIRLISKEDSKSSMSVPFKKTGSNLSVAVKKPKKPETKDIISKLKERGYNIKKYMVSKNSLERAWKFYEDLSSAAHSESGILDISTEEISKEMKVMDSLEDVKNEIENVLNEKRSHKTSRIVEIFFAGALALDASDVHIEPGDEKTRLRFRLDGVLHSITDIDNETYKLIQSRLKLISGFKLNVTDRPQDGRFSIKFNEKEIEVRSSSIPGNYGESLVMRILDPESIMVSMEQLGMTEDFLDTIKYEIQKPHGMILITGPTGSGKTTSLYTFLRKINKPETKIITIENPIEYHLKGVVQTQTEEDTYSFLGGLRSALRQDPDTIMIGEIREQNVAQTAIDAALTGHLVFSTLHTNTAAGAFPRIIDLKINPKVIGSAINIVLAQRLVRKLCDECKKETFEPQKYKDGIQKITKSIEKKDKKIPKETKFYKPVGCKKCNNIGYKGRVGIFEAVLMDKEVEEMVRSNPSERDIVKISKKQNILNMKEDGILKVLKGITSIEELERTIELPTD